MKEFHESLYQHNDYQYPSLDFTPSIHGYLHEDDICRPAVIVVPGGGYSLVSPTEGEIVAKKFYESGYQTFVVTYTTNMFQMQTLFWQPLKDLAKAVRHVRSQAVRYNVIANNIAICGFSAGGHLCGSLAVHFEHPEIVGDISARPDAVILSYPVISSGTYAHRGSFDNLIGKEPTESDLATMSLELQVKENTPPVFLWHTMTDLTVPVENSLLFLSALKEKNIFAEAHFFPEGKHGLSLANQAWANHEFGNGFYTLEQVYDSSKMLQKKSPESLPDVFRHASESTFEAFVIRFGELMKSSSAPEDVPVPDDAIATWPELAHLFLTKVWVSTLRN